MIYLVDDSADYRFLIQQVFNRFLPDYPIRLFADGLALIQTIELDPDLLMDDLTRSDLSPCDPKIPNLIILDVDMPQLDGFQTLAQLKQYPRWQPIPVVMMTNRIDSDFESTAYQLGANDYLIKPLKLVGIKDSMLDLCHKWVET